MLINHETSHRPAAVPSRGASSGRRHFRAMASRLGACLCWTAGLAAFLVFALLVTGALGGCAVGRSLDTNDPMFGIALGDPGVVEAASGIGGVVGGLLGGPVGAASGTALFGGIATLIWGSRQRAVGQKAGEDRGWNDAAATYSAPPVPVVASAVPAGGGSASRVGPAAGGAA